MTGISNIGLNPYLSPIQSVGVAPSARVAGRIDRLEQSRVDTVELRGRGGESAENSGVYSEREILSKILADDSEEDVAANGLDESEQQMVEELAARDREVRAHEAAHAALLGRYAISGPSYTYQMGPDGKAYAVGGSIMADTGRGATPEETRAKARVLARAAMGGGESSAADRAVASAANKMGIQAIA